jgi:hypothetical protein
MTRSKTAAQSNIEQHVSLPAQLPILEQNQNELTLEIPPYIQFKAIRDDLNHHIRKQLNPSLVSIYRKGDIGISKPFFEYIKAEYNIGGQFQPCNDFVNEFNIVTRRNLPDLIHYCIILENGIQFRVSDEDSFLYIGQDNREYYSFSRYKRLYFKFNRNYV